MKQQLIYLISLMLFSVACMESSSNNEVDLSSITVDEEAVAEFLKLEGITEYQKTPSGIIYLDYKEGTGKTYHQDSIINVSLSTFYLNSGAIFSNPDFSFDLYNSTVITGVPLFLSEMEAKEGASARIFIPRLYASGLGRPVIEAHLTFNHALSEAEQLNKEIDSIKSYFHRQGITDYEVTAENLVYKTLVPGSGVKPEAGEALYMDYRGDFTDGIKFDENADNEITRSDFVNFVPGFNEALDSMEIGETALVGFPSGRAYGAAGGGEEVVGYKSIPSYSPLIFKISIRKNND